MPRLILALDSGAQTADVRASVAGVSGVEDAVEAQQANAVLVSVPQVTSDLRQRLLSQPGVSDIFDDIQAIPQVASQEEVEDFLDRVRDLRGEEHVPPVIETKPVESRAASPARDSTRDGDPDVRTDGGAVFPGVATEDIRPFNGPEGPIQSVDDSIQSVGASTLHDEGVRGEDIISVVVDTGSCGDAIKDERQRDGDDLTGQDDPWQPYIPHGGMTTGIMAGDESTPGVDVGFLPGSDVYPIKTSLAGTELIQAQDIIANLADETDKFVVVNNSWGFPSCSGLCNHPLTNAIQSTATKENVVQVFAAGNSGSDCGKACDGSKIGINGPNSLTDVITVAATGRGGHPDQIHVYSSRGGPEDVECGREKPDVAAPIHGGVPYGCGSRDVGDRGGTSAAAPMVSGAVGLLVADVGPASTESIKSRLREAATAEEFDGCDGAGNINVAETTALPPPGGTGTRTRAAIGIGIGIGMLGAILASSRQQQHRQSAR